MMAVAVALPWGAPLTYDDLQGMPDDGHRYELVDGVLLVTPAPGTIHQACVVSLVALLYAARHRDHSVLVAPYDYRVRSTTVLQPDILVARRADLGERLLERAPLLVVEVHSPSTRLADLGTKRLAYESAGVPSYWMVDPAEPRLTVLTLRDGRYVEEASVTGDQPYEASYPFSLTVVPSHLVDA